MTHLKTPLGEHLDDSVSEVELRRVWLAVERQRRAPRLSFFSQSKAGFAWTAGFAVALAVLTLVLWRSEPGPLVLASGASVSEVGGANSAQIALSDGSQIETAASSKLEVIENETGVVTWALREGRATFDVKPGGGRRWQIEAGRVTVKVVGTKFMVAREGARVQVVVERGVVLVRGENVPDGVQRLTAGQRIEVAGEEPEKAPIERAEVSDPSGAITGVQVAPELEKIAPGAQEPQLAPVTPDSGRQSKRTLDELLAQADLERQEGRIEQSVDTLQGAVREHGSEPRAALALFTLGKLLLDALDRPLEAEQALKRCLSLSPPAGLAEDALARLVQARVRTGQVALAKESALKYERLYPNGRRLIDVQRWIEGD